MPGRVRMSFKGPWVGITLGPRSIAWVWTEGCQLGRVWLLGAGEAQLDEVCLWVEVGREQCKYKGSTHPKSSEVQAIIWIPTSRSSGRIPWNTHSPLVEMRIFLAIWLGEKWRIKIQNTHTQIWAQNWSKIVETNLKKKRHLTHKCALHILPFC